MIRNITCDECECESTVVEEAFVELLESLVIPPRPSCFLILQRPTISGNMPKINEPNPKPNMAPIFDNRRIVDVCPVIGDTFAVVVSSIFFN